MDSSRTHDSSNYNNSIINNNTTNVNIANTASTFPQIPTPSHSRDHTTITLTPPPEYTVIDTQPQSKVMLHPSINNRLSDISITAEDAPIINSSEQLKFCKICQEPEESNSSVTLDEDDSETYNKGKLISPCKCKGSLQYVHIGCLNKWRHSNVRLEASYRCEVCKYEYRFYRPRIAKLFSSSLTLHILSLALLLSTIYLSSYIVKLLIKYNNDINDPNNDPPPHLPGRDKIKWQDITFLNIRLIEFIIGVTIISCFGLIFFIIMICCNGFSHTRHNFCYCGGCGSCSGFGYGFIGTDCSAGGDCGSILILFFLLFLALIFTLGFVGAIIAAYLSIQKITTICLEKVHDRILEVKKD